MLQMSKIDIQTLEDAADEVDRWKNPISSMTP